MEAFGRGNADAFELLYHRHKGGVHRYFLRQCRDRGAAEELFQELWMRVIGARERYEVRARFTTWLYCLAHNLLTDHYRRRSRRPTASSGGDCPAVHELPAASNGPDLQAHAQRQTERLLVLLQDLPEAQREAFVLREEAGLSVAEIAQATGVGTETAKSRLRYAVAALRRGLTRGDEA